MNWKEQWKRVSKSNKPIIDLLSNIGELPEEIQTAVRNNGGGHANHTLFFSHLTHEKVEVPAELSEKINQAFGSFEAFQEQFSVAAASVFGSGWAFLCLDDQNNLMIQILIKDLDSTQHGELVH